MPVSDAKVVTVHPTPTESSSYDEILTYAVNLGDRASSKPRETALKALEKAEKDVMAAKPADMDKKLEQIKACRARIIALADYLRDQSFYTKFILAKTSPSVSASDVEDKLTKAGDKEFLKLKGFRDAAQKKNEDAIAHMNKVAAEYIDKR